MSDLKNTNPFLNNYGARDMTLTRASGSYVWDNQDKKYIDCIMGIAVHALGHNYPPVITAVQKQLGLLSHVSNYFVTPSQQALADSLLGSTEFDKVFFCNSGTEAIEALIKITRKYHITKGNESKTEIITFEKSFHGRTYGALSATGQSSLKEQFGPMLSGFKHVPVNNVALLEQAIDKNTAAILFEPILAEGGVLSLSSDVVKILNQAQNEGVLLLCDEIQTGMGRTGSFLASTFLGVRPDAVTLAKALGGGLPLGAVLLKYHMADCIVPGDHGSTFGGNPLACAAGVEVVNLTKDSDFLKEFSSKSRYFRKRLAELVTKHKTKGFSLPLRGKGFLIGIPYSGPVKEFLSKLRQNGLLACAAGADVIRLLPNLNLEYGVMDEILAIFENTMVEL